MSDRQQALDDALRCLDELDAALRAFADNQTPAAEWLILAGVDSSRKRVASFLKAHGVFTIGTSCDLELIKW
jgi:molecular chaperone GrpE (heat shock protein)